MGSQNSEEGNQAPRSPSTFGSVAASLSITVPTSPRAAASAAPQERVLTPPVPLVRPAAVDDGLAPTQPLDFDFSDIQDPPGNETPDQKGSFSHPPSISLMR